MRLQTYLWGQIKRRNLGKAFIYIYIYNLQILEQYKMAASGSSNRFGFTPELADDRQAAVLYSPFRDKNLNPHSYIRKMKFWENLLLKTFTERRKISFDLSKLPEMFERNGLTPRCLGTVVDKMKRSGQLQPISDYHKSNGWLAWGFNTLVKQPVYWGVTQLIGSPKKDSEVFVCRHVLKQIAEEVLELHHSRVRFGVVDCLLPLIQFKESCQHLVHEAGDLEILLTYLEKENLIALSRSSGNEVIVKFRKEGESRVSFEEIDFHIYSIKAAVDSLEKEVNVLTIRVDRHLEEAKNYVKEGRKKMALMCLKKKASLQRLIDRKSGSLAMLFQILQKIEEAGTNDMIVKACKAGAQAMKMLNAEVTVENAEAVMDDVHEAIAAQEEINGIIGSEMSTEDEEELERSLEELLKENFQEHTTERCAFDKGASSKVLSKGSNRTDSIPTEDDIDVALSSLEINDLGLPEVPFHLPDERSMHDKNKEKIPAA